MDYMDANHFNNSWNDQIAPIHLGNGNGELLNDIEDLNDINGFDDPASAEMEPIKTLPAETLPPATVPAATVPAETVPGATVPAVTLSAATEPANKLPAHTVPARMKQ